MQSLAEKLKVDRGIRPVIFGKKGNKLVNKRRSGLNPFSKRLSHINGTALSFDHSNIREVIDEYDETKSSRYLEDDSITLDGDASLSR